MVLTAEIFEELFHGSQVYLCRFLALRGCRDCEDVVAQAWVQAWGKRSQFRGESMNQARAWLRKIAWNCFLSALRKEPMDQLIPELETAQSIHPFHTIDNHICLDQILALAPAEARLALLKDMAERPYPRGNSSARVVRYRSLQMVRSRIGLRKVA